MPLKAVILIGGETTGTRFRPLSMDSPKALFPIAGKPLISHIIDNLLDLGDEELVNVYLLGYFKEINPFKEYISNAKHLYPSLNIKYLAEPYSMGTGGGIYYFRESIFYDGLCDKVLVVHGDIICDYPFKDMIDFYRENGANSVILGIDPLFLMKNYQNKIQVQNQRSFKVYDSYEVFSNYGTIISDKQTSAVVHYVEKPTSKFPDYQSQTEFTTLINGGVYLFDKSILELLAKAQYHKSCKIDDYLNYDHLENDSKHANVLSLELDVLKILPEAKCHFVTYKSNSFWYQLKTPISALFANIFFLESYLQQESSKNLAPPSNSILPPVILASPLHTPTSNYKIGPNVSIGKNVSIGSGVRLKNCIILDDVSIGDHSFVANAIISKEVKIGKWCRIEGSFNNDTVDKYINDIKSDGYFKLINNIVVLCQNTVVNNQVFVYNSLILPYKELKNDVKYEIIM